MIGDLSLIVRNNYNQRDDEAATILKIEETAAMLNRELKTDVFKTYKEPEYNNYYVYDSRKKSDFMEITIYNGFWMIDTAWRYFQYFDIYEGKLWLRDLMYKYVKLLGGTEAYATIEYCTWNSKFWKDEKTTFDDWFNGCTAELGHPIESLDIADVMNRKEGEIYNKEHIYLDSYKDLE